MKRIILVLTIGLFYASLAIGQRADSLIRYTPDFKFRDGIYLNFDMVKTNSPIPKAKLLTSVDNNDKDFFNQVISGEKIYYYDNEGKESLVRETDIAFSLLSVTDQTLFRKGVIRHSPEELDELLQDFES